jgi:hypothetical protein
VTIASTLVCRVLQYARRLTILSTLTDSFSGSSLAQRQSVLWRQKQCEMGRVLSAIGVADAYVQYQLKSSRLRPFHRREMGTTPSSRSKLLADKSVGWDEGEGFAVHLVWSHARFTECCAALNDRRKYEQRLTGNHAGPIVSPDPSLSDWRSHLNHRQALSARKMEDVSD